MRLKEEMTLADVVHLAIYNLTLDSGKKYHDLDRSILPFLDANLEILQPSDEVWKPTQFFTFTTFNINA